MINAPYEKEFVFQDGQRAKNLLELSVIIEKISQQDFEKFVNPSKNDFANWTEYVLQDKEFAASLRSTISLPKTKELINNRLIIEKNSASSLNTEQKKPLFNIFKQNKDHQVVELKKPIEKLPEPEHHKIELLTGSVSEVKPKKRWFSKKDSVKNDMKNIPNKQEDNNQDGAIKKDNSLRKWYEFKRNAKNAHNQNAGQHSSQHNPQDPDHGNIFWVVIYGALILLILILVVYKFILQQ